MQERKQMNNFIVLYVVQKIRSTQVIAGTLHARVTTWNKHTWIPMNFLFYTDKYTVINATGKWAKVIYSKRAVPNSLKHQRKTKSGRRNQFALVVTSFCKNLDHHRTAYWLTWGSNLHKKPKIFNISRNTWESSDLIYACLEV